MEGLTPVAIVSLVAMLGWLLLMLRNSEIQKLGLSRGAMLAFTWIAIFIVVALVVGQIMA